MEFLKQENLHQEDLQRHREELERQRQEDLKQQEKKFLKLLETFSKRENDPGSANIFSRDSVINSLGEFLYNPDEEVTFEVYFRRYEEIFQKDCATWSDGKKRCVYYWVNSAL